MSAAPVPPAAAPPPPAPGVCAICEVPLGPNDRRCPECGLRQTLGPGRPNPFAGTVLWTLIGALAVLWVVVLLVVLAAR